jgi:hypothetical protein
VTSSNRTGCSRTYFRTDRRRSALPLGWGLAIGVGLLATACGRFVSAIPIGQVLSQTSNQASPATQTIRGTVVTYAPLLTGSFYQLKDDSGSIWVRSSQVVAPGDRLTIEGVPRHQAIQISNQEVGEVYFEEQKQVDRQGK